MNGDIIVEGRCADCVMDLLQLSGRGPGRYGYCRLRDIPLEHPWAMVCKHYQYWGDRPDIRHKRNLLDRPSFPLLDYSKQKPIKPSVTVEDIKERHKDEGDDNIKRNVGALETSREFIKSPVRKKTGMIWGFLNGYNPYNFVIAVNVFHHFPVEKVPEDKRMSIYEKLLDPERKADLSGDQGIVADKIVYAVGWSQARLGRDLMEYIDSLKLKKNKPEYERRLLEEALEFVRDPEKKPKSGIFGFLFGK